MDIFKKKQTLIDKATQFLLPALTLIAQFTVSSGNPKWGLTFNLLAQPFWVYSSWKAYKNAGQIGLFVISVIMTIIVGWGVINYWFFL